MESQMHNPNKLKKDQRAAVTYMEGPLTVFAGAGTGKTTILENRYEYLIKEKDVNPEHILVTTFTKDAANEISERISTDSNVTTLHGQFNQIVKENADAFGYSQPPIPITEGKDKQREIVKGIIEDIVSTQQVNQNIIEDTAEVFTNKIDKCRKNLNVNSIVSENSNVEFNLVIKGEKKEIIGNADKTFKEVFNKYNEQLRQENLIDYTAMIYKAYKLLSNNEELSNYYKQKFEHIMVDEAQDLNQLQYEILKLISDKSSNIVLIGDDCQNIYSWRGADHKLMKRFEEEFNAERKTIEINFRSTQQLIKTTNKINQILEDDVVNKELKSYKGGSKKSINHPKTRIYEKIFDEQEAVADEISNLIRTKDYDPDEIAVISRTNRPLSNVYKKVRVGKQIPAYNDRGNQFFNRKEIQYILDFCKVYINSESDRLVKTFLDNYVRNIGDSALENIEEYSDTNIWQSIEDLPSDNDIKGVGPKTARNIREATSFVTSLNRADDPIKKIVSDKRWKTDIDSFCNGYDSENKENVDLLRTKVLERGFNEEGLQQFFDDVINNIDDTEMKGVRFTTVHGSKGMEWKVVFLINMVEDNFPLKYAKEAGEIEEEKRNFYVALTRAKEKCFLTSHREGFEGMSAEPSSFLQHIS